MPRMNLKNAISAINKHGILLVFPIKGRDHVPSLWRYFFGDEPMRWEWTEDADDKVPALWHLRAALSESGEVVYTKWFQGKATVISQELFTALISVVTQLPTPLNGLIDEAKEIYKVLEEDSPLATKELRELSGFEGRERETLYQRALRQLWNRLLVVGYGEKEEGGFPSLAVGASRLMFEELWDRSKELSEQERESIISKFVPEKSPFYRSYLRLLKETDASSCRLLGP